MVQPLTSELQTEAAQRSQGLTIQAQLECERHTPSRSKMERAGDIHTADYFPRALWFEGEISHMAS